MEKILGTEHLAVKCQCEKMYWGCSEGSGEPLAVGVMALTCISQPWEWRQSSELGTPAGASSSCWLSLERIII